MAAHPFRLKQKKKEACTRLVARFPMPVAGFPPKRVFSTLGIANKVVTYKHGTAESSLNSTVEDRFSLESRKPP